MSVQRCIGIVVVGLALARPAGGQGAWAPPQLGCDVKAGHFLVNGGLQYLQSAAKTGHETQRQKDLRDANRVLTQAVATGGQQENPAAWYYLGRYYVAVNDPAGADTAFSRVERLKPNCAADVAFWRRAMWVPVFNSAVAAWQAGNTDSAAASFRQANAIYRGEPHGFLYLGMLLTNQGQLDSAAHYFEQGVEISGGDPKYADEQRDATFNLARVYQAIGKPAQAAAAFRAYLQLVPGDPEALAGLAAYYAEAGQMDSARALYTQVLDRADSLDAETLFRAGVGIFQGAPKAPDSAAMTRSCRSEPPPAGTAPAPSPRRIAVRCDSIAAAAMKAHRAASGDVYRTAARAFEAGLAKNPHSRDGLFNLTNSYLALNDSANMLPVAQRLSQVDPMSRTGLRLVAQAWSFRGNPDSTLRYLILGDSLLAVDVNVSSFTMREQGATLEGVATNFHRRSSRALTIAVDFLDQKGVVVSTQTVEVPALRPDSTHRFQATGTGAGMVAWRYKKAS